MNGPAPGFAKHPSHVVDIARPECRVTVRLGERILADSRAALLVRESRHDPVWYFPPQDVDREVLSESASSTYCPFKGHASYHGIRTDAGELQDAVWCYREPYDECRALAGYLAFYADRVSIEVDGDPQRPT